MKLFNVAAKILFLMAFTLAAPAAMACGEQTDANDKVIHESASSSSSSSGSTEASGANVPVTQPAPVAPH